MLTATESCRPLPASHLHRLGARSYDGRMGKTWLAIAAVLPACVINPPHERVEATWTIERLDAGEVDCPADWVTAVLVTADTRHPDVEIEDRFACADRDGLSSQLTEGSYRTWIEFRDHADSLITTSLPQTIEVGAFVTPVESTIYLDAGYVATSWSWETERWCSDSWNPFQLIRLTMQGPSSQTALFSCEQDGGITSPMLPGTYSVSLGQGFNGQALPDITVEAPNRVTHLPAVTF